jgi:ribosome maturation factor RimP
MPIIEEHNFELVDVEYVKEGGTWYLRAYIDKEGGITVDDCEVVSRALGELLDVEDFIDEAYILEVSSPGLGRPLKKEKDFVRSIGKEVDVKVPKYTQDMDSIFLNGGYGINGGNYTIVVKASMPTSVSKEEQELLEKIQKHHKQ